MELCTRVSRNVCEDTNKSCSSAVWKTSDVLDVDVATVQNTLETRLKNFVSMPVAWQGPNRMSIYFDLIDRIEGLMALN